MPSFNTVVFFCLLVLFFFKLTSRRSCDLEAAESEQRRSPGQSWNHQISIYLPSPSWPIEHTRNRSDVLFFRKSSFCIRRRRAVFFLWGGRRRGSGGSILGDLGVKILKITDNQNVLGKVGGGGGEVFCKCFQGFSPWTSDLESPLSRQLNGFKHVTKTNKKGVVCCMLLFLSFVNCLSVCISVCLPCIPELAKQPLHCASQW